MAIENIFPVPANPVNEMTNVLSDIYVGEISNDLNFRKSLFNLINIISPKKYSITTADFINPTRTSDYSRTNTRITMFEVPNLGIFNPRSILYNRVHTNRLGVLTLPKNSAINISDLIDDINAFLGTSILASEIEDSILPDANILGKVSFQLSFNNTSFRYYSGPEIIIKLPTTEKFITKQSLGLGNVDNTSDLTKPVSLAELQLISDTKSSIEQYILDHPGSCSPTPTLTPTASPTSTPSPTTTPTPTPYPTQGGGSVSIIETFRNASGLPMPRGTPVYSSNAQEVDGAVGNSAKHRVIGLNANTEPLLAGVNGDFIIDGSLICTGPEWQAITDMPGGLVRGRKYFLDTIFPGKLRLNIDTKNALPGSYLVCVGYAITATELKIEIQSPIRLA